MFSPITLAMGLLDLQKLRFWIRPKCSRVRCYYSEEQNSILDFNNCCVLALTLPMHSKENFFMMKNIVCNGNPWRLL